MMTSYVRLSGYYFGKYLVFRAQGSNLFVSDYFAFLFFFLVATFI
jgi:hypothetical protein